MENAIKYKLYYNEQLNTNKIDIQIIDSSSKKELENITINTNHGNLVRCLNVKDARNEYIYENDILTDEGSFGHDTWDYGLVIYDESESSYYIIWMLENICEYLGNADKYFIYGNKHTHGELAKKILES